MSYPVVNKLGGEKSLSFLLSWRALDTSLILNFEPLVASFNPKPPFVIGHFQAIPFGHRNFGYLFVDENCNTSYQTLNDNQIQIQSYPKQISVPEADPVYIDVRPTAVYLFEQSILYEIGNKTILKKI